MKHPAKGGAPSRSLVDVPTRTRSGAADFITDTEMAQGCATAGNVREPKREGV